MLDQNSEDTGGYWPGSPPVPSNPSENDAPNPETPPELPPPPPSPPVRPTRRLKPNERPPNPYADQGAIWNDDWWDGKSVYLGGWLIPDGTPFTPTKGGWSGPTDDWGTPTDFAWPEFEAPIYTPGAPFAADPYAPGAPFQPPPAFTYDAWTPPSFESIRQDPSYLGRKDEGLSAIEHGAAAKGLTRMPATLQALGAWNQDFASREYGNIYNREGQAYDRNRSNAADAYSLNYGVSRDTWDRGETSNLNAYDRNYRSGLDAYDRNYTGAKDEFTPRFDSAKLRFEDLYRRWKAQLDSDTTIATAYP